MPISRLFNSYFSSFQGLSKEVWWLALITLINRAGTMVIPFMSLYLTEGKGFTLANVGWIMTAFGLGSVCGSWLGGYLNDKIGSYKTMVLSLVSSGVMFILTQFMDSFWSIAFFVFLILLCADIFRPAMFVALRAYSKPENQTRSISLIRLAINLGFSAGPVVGGFLIFQFGYGSLFWVDGLTCFAAMFILLYSLNPKKSEQKKEEIVENPKSPYSDWVYLLFCLGMVCFGFVFLQYFSTVPLYYNRTWGLSEEYIGLLLGFNGLLVFVLEMPIIHYIEKKGRGNLQYVVVGMILLLISFLIMIIIPSIGILWFGIVLMSIGEIYVFPFSNAFAMERSKRGRMGQYMALYSISFSIAHIFGHNAGLQMIDKIGFDKTWWFMIFVCIFGALVFLLVRRNHRRETDQIIQ
jgi:predicted MFS family arabinose efflux permease